MHQAHIHLGMCRAWLQLPAQTSGIHYLIFFRPSYGTVALKNNTHKSHYSLAQRSELLWDDSLCDPYSNSLK